MKPLTSSMTRKEKSTRHLFLIIMSTVFMVSCATSSAPEVREYELSDKRCATTFKRITNVIKYFPPNPKTYANPIMYNEDGIGMRGYDMYGDLHYRGCVPMGLTPDKHEAFTWYQHAALGHVPESQYKLGKMLYLGDGIESNRKLGISWLMSAAAEGSEAARKLLLELQIEPPKPLSITSYDTYVARHQRMIQESRQQFWSDVANLATIALSIQPKPISKSQTVEPYPVQPRPELKLITRPRPVYCTSNAYVSTSEAANSVYLTGMITTFCH